MQQRPNNDPFKRRGKLYELPPAQSTRSSTSDFITTPEFTGATASLTVSSGPQRTPVLHPATASATVSERLHTPPRFDVTKGGVDESRGARPKTTTSTIYRSDDEVSVRTTNASGTTSGGPIVATAGAPTTTTTIFVTGVGDATFAPPSFRRNKTEDTNDWLSRFEKYASFRDMTDKDRLRLVAVLLRDTASEWWHNLDNTTKGDWGLFKTAFKNRFEDAGILKSKKVSDLWSRVQGPTESVNEYVTAVRKLARALGVAGEQKQYAEQRGLRPQILARVIELQTTTLEDVIQAAKVAEAAQTVIDQATTPTNTDVNRMTGELAASRIVAEANNQEIRKLTDQLAKQPTVRNISRSSSPSSQRGQSPAQRRVTFADDGPRRTYRQSSQSSRGQFVNYRQCGSSSELMPTMLCGNCGGNHQFGRQFCRAYNIQCYNCQKFGHIARCCGGVRRGTGVFQIGVPHGNHRLGFLQPRKAGIHLKTHDVAGSEILI